MVELADARVEGGAARRRPSDPLFACQGIHLDLGGREILRDIATKRGPKQSLIAFGYAGWGAGQLENELARRAWYTAPDDADLIFETDRDKVWDEAVKRRTQNL